ncbi:hypothetical protein [Lactiplantibacillus plajomi]|uniref:Uncharacterized protein n=1 Tax=Lactiplantibacillus plajomi TaxID=1457217 RepID=A0ABV6K5F6_9LACO|nr:hypothetical protein [Lactiplantibacillus plajomi]
MLACQNCGKPLKRTDRAYFLLEVPHRSIGEIRSFLAVNSVAYCPDCVQIMRTKALN